MRQLQPDSPEAMARVLALFVVADERVSPDEIQTLHRLGAFEQLGMSSKRFLQVAGDFSLDLGGPHAWMRLADLYLIDGLLDGVRDPEMRLRLARLAAAVITADGRIDQGERLIFDRMLIRWGLTRSRVVRAIREDRQGREDYLVA
jgi:uncharacterized tellurite resistance protein B-like protein